MKLCQSRQSISTCSRAHLLCQKLNPLIITSNSTYIHASTINLYMYRVHHVYTHGTISTTLLSNNQLTGSLNSRQKVNLNVHRFCTNVLVPNLYVKPFNRTSHKHRSTWCTCKLTTFHIQFFHFLCYSQGTRATDQRTRVTDTTPTLHQYTRAIFTWFGGGGRLLVGIFSLKLSWAVKVASWGDTACYVCRKELVDWTGSLRYCMYLRKRKSN